MLCLDPWVRLLRSVANRGSGAAVRSPLLALPDPVRTTKRPDFPFSIRNRNVLTRLRRWRDRNWSESTRVAAFIGYAYRWIRPKEPMYTETALATATCAVTR